ncbi:hypothetical protein [Mucilaginibacter sp.]|uniref:hypothetical protein n=1 Tax=Mucilaginibacter sp. TaxID=1882438 RepID=UPI00283BC367|nr:hypothetical protein [Mucilaginibacter sp.]MDR3696401.1 hypothetical protein [Mucilaginibacter sp.]
MNIQNTKNKPLNSRGSAIFKKMLEDKKAIHEHLQKGGKLTDLKDKYNFATPLSLTGKR